MSASPSGSVQPPVNALRNDPLPDAEEGARREAARALLPWNRRVLDAPTGQALAHVGEPSLRQIQSGAAVPPLFQPFSLGPLRLKNRIAVSPMCTYSSDDGFLNDWHLAHLGQFGIGGAGLVIVEATAVAPEGRISPVDSGLWKDAQIEPLRRIVALLRSQNAAAGIQLAHAGRKASTLPAFQYPRPPAPMPISAIGPELGGWPERVVGPSAIAYDKDYHVPREMTIAEIQQFKQHFLDAARRALDAGFDYIEIHAAHGYLLSSFLSATSNRRTDAYGGSFENRCRLLVELTREMRALVPREKCALGVRVSCSEWLEKHPDPELAERGWTSDDTVRLAGLLAPLGIDLLDCSSAGNHPAQNIKVQPGYQLHFAEEVKRAYPQLNVSAVGLITEPAQADAIVAQGQADVVMLAREFLRAPHWPLTAARELGFDLEWSPQYQRGKPSTKSVKTQVHEEKVKEEKAKAAHIMSSVP